MVGKQRQRDILRASQEGHGAREVIDLLVDQSIFIPLQVRAGLRVHVVDGQRAVGGEFGGSDTAEGAQA